jgi:hypothetical protein
MMALVNNTLKVLYLGPNRIYTNPNVQLIPLLFKAIYDVSFFGPGYVSKEELNTGIKSFNEKNGPFDVLVIDGTIFFWDEQDGEIPFTTSFNYFDSNFDKTIILDMIKYFSDAKINKILFPNIDYYHIKKKEIEKIEKADPYIITRDISFWRRKKETEDIDQELFFNNVNDNWYNFISYKKEKIISFPGIIAINEFKYHPLSIRPNDIIVPGVKYYYRKLAISQIKSTNIKMRTKIYEQTRPIISRIIRYTNSRILINLFNSYFNGIIEDSKIAYTCGSALGYPLRKFIEIPAKGTLLISNPFFGFENFGFIDGHNFISAHPNEILEKTTFYLSNLDKAQQIAINGQTMVFNNHSFYARMNQLLLITNSMINNSFLGSRWVNGAFELI